MAAQQIEELGLQRGSGTISIEVGEKRIVAFLEYDRCIEACAEPLGQRSLAGADRTFDRDVAELQGRHDDIIANADEAAYGARDRVRLHCDGVRQRTGRPAASAAGTNIRRKDVVD